MNNGTIFWRLLPALACVVGTSACGYSFSGVGANALPRDYHSVAVPTFENRSAESSLGSACSQSLQDGLLAGGVVTTDPEEADLVVRGVVHSIQDQPVGVEQLEPGAHNVEMELVVVIDVIATVVDTEVWRGEGISAGALYTTAGPIPEVHARRVEASKEACDLAVTLARQELVAHLNAHPEYSQVLLAPLEQGDNGDNGDTEDTEPKQDPLTPVGKPPGEDKERDDIADPQR